MAEPFLSEMRIFSFSFPPKGWAFCNGQLLPINQNQGLFSLLGTTYGGDGRVNFALPNLQGRVPIHMGNGHTLGERAGEESHTLSISELPAHTHLVRASDNPATSVIPNESVIGKAPGPNFSDKSPGPVYESATSMMTGTNALGQSQAHLNMQPFLTMNVSIALQGIFPSSY